LVWLLSADFPAAVWRLLTNSVYMVTCLGICCEVSIVSGFVVFLPKYLETEFGASKSAANLLTGKYHNPRYTEHLYVD